MRSPGPMSGLLCILLAAAALGTHLPAAEKEKAPPSPGPRAPKDPASPSADLRDPKDAGRQTDLSATIVTARGDKKTGTLALKAGTIEVSASEEGVLKKRSLAIGDIDSIEITRWRGEERRKNEFAFYPDEMKITLRDNKVLRCAGRIALLNRLSFKDSGGSRFVYSHFYDYWKGSVWKNCGQPDRSYPETNPYGDTLVKIVFLREEMKNPLEKLLSR